MTDSVSPSPAAAKLVDALRTNNAPTVQSLIAGGAAIHNLSVQSSHTPLQEALSLSSPVPFHTLLSQFFASTHPTHLSERTAVIDEITRKIFPSFEPVSEEWKEDSDRSDAIAVVENALTAIRNGEFIVVTDSDDRENEGDLIIAAEKMTAEKMAFLVNETSGIACVGITDDRCRELALPQMVDANTESHQTAFTVTIDFRPGMSTGISASDRAATIRALADASVKPDDFTRPGHVFPLRAKPNGVLDRPGHTEASVDLARLAGLYPAGAMCEIVHKDGSMMRPAALRQWSKRHGLVMITIHQLIEYRKRVGK